MFQIVYFQFHRIYSLDAIWDISKRQKAQICTRFEKIETCQGSKLMRSVLRWTMKVIKIVQKHIYEVFDGLWESSYDLKIDLIDLEPLNVKFLYPNHVHSSSIWFLIHHKLHLLNIFSEFRLLMTLECAKDKVGYDYEINALNFHIAYFSPRSIFCFSLFK